MVMNNSNILDSLGGTVAVAAIATLNRLPRHFRRFAVTLDVGVFHIGVEFESRAALAVVGDLGAHDLGVTTTAGSLAVCHL